MPVCYECGEPGHTRPNCPSIECHRCHRLGHMARECTGAGRPQQQRGQYRPKTGGDANPRLSSNLPPPSSNTHKIPNHWKIAGEYTSLTGAVTGLWKQSMKFKMFEADTVERGEIEQLLRKTWKETVVGVGADARNLNHSNIQVVKVERIENPELYERYSERKQKMLRRLRDPDLGDTAFSRVDNLPGSSGPVMTTKYMPFDSFLRRNIYPKINEHYLFHGTKDEYVLIIARDGMDNRFGSKNSLLGAGLYTAESSTKADQYTDAKASRTRDLQKMFLVRVLVGEPYLNISKNPPKFERPPCKNCHQILCSCLHTTHYDSVLDDSGRLFREFVVYEQCQCYPEYAITYRRVGGTASTPSYGYAPSAAQTTTVSRPPQPVVPTPAYYTLPGRPASTATGSTSCASTAGSTPSSQTSYADRPATSYSPPRPSPKPPKKDDSCIIL